MCIDVPPPRKDKPFEEGAPAIIVCIRTNLPDIRAVRKGSRLVIVRQGEREAHLKMDSSSPAACWITFSFATIATTMASLYDERRDDFTISNLAHTVAGYFDPRFTRA